MKDSDILQLHDNGMSVLEISRKLGISSARVYYRLSLEEMRQDSKIYRALIEEHVSPSEAMSTVKALARVHIFSLEDLLYYVLEGGVLTDIYRIGDERASALEAILSDDNVQRLH